MINYTQTQLFLRYCSSFCHLEGEYMYENQNCFHSPSLKETYFQKQIKDSSTLSSFHDGFIMGESFLEDDEKRYQLQSFEPEVSQSEEDNQGNDDDDLIFVDGQKQEADDSQDIPNFDFEEDRLDINDESAENSSIIELKSQRKDLFKNLLKNKVGRPSIKSNKLKNFFVLLGQHIKQQFKRINKKSNNLPRNISSKNIEPLIYEHKSIILKYLINLSEYTPPMEQPKTDRGRSIEAKKKEFQKKAIQILNQYGQIFEIK